MALPCRFAWNGSSVQEFWNILTSDSVLPFSLLLIPFGIYWIIFCFGFIDLDLEGDGDGSHDHGALHGALSSVMRFMNAHDVPVMLVLSLITLFTWVAAMIGAVLIPATVPFREATIAITAIIIGIILTKVLTRPLAPLFKFIKSAEPADPIIGKAGIVRTREITQEKGQVEVLHRGIDALLTARLPEGAAPLPRGTEVIIYDHNSDTGIYSVREAKLPSV